MIGSGATAMGSARRRGGAPEPVRLDLFENLGTFTRSSSATYVGNEDGDIFTALANERRIEGGMLLLEGSRTNIVTYSQDWSVGAWIKSNVTVGTDTGAVAPDGSTTADTLSFTANANAQVYTQFTLSNSVPLSGSVWMRSTDGSPQQVRLLIRAKDGSLTTATCDLDGQWRRFTVTTFSILTGATTPALMIRNGLDGAARDIDVWGAQAEQATWPSSFISTAGSSGTRAVDQLTYATGEYPEDLCTQKAHFTIVPRYSQAEYAATTAGEIQRFLRIVSGGGDEFRLQNVSGTTPTLELLIDNVVQWSATPTWSRGDVWDITIDWIARTVTLSGFTTGNGTSAIGGSGTWSTGLSLDVGHSASATPVFCYMGRYIEVPT